MAASAAAELEVVEEELKMSRGGGVGGADAVSGVEMDASADAISGVEGGAEYLSDEYFAATFGAN